MLQAPFEGARGEQLLRSLLVSGTAKALGIIIPVLVATTFCLTVPFILIIADAAVLGAAVLIYLSDRGADRAAEEAWSESE